MISWDREDFTRWFFTLRPRRVPSLVPWFYLPNDPGWSEPELPRKKGRSWVMGSWKCWWIHMFQHQMKHILQQYHFIHSISIILSKWNIMHTHRYICVLCAYCVYKCMDLELCASHCMWTLLQRGDSGSLVQEDAVTWRHYVSKI